MKNIFLLSLSIFGCATYPSLKSDYRQPAFATANVLAEDRDVTTAQGLKTLDYPKVAANDPNFAQSAAGVFSNADTPAVLRFLRFAKATIDIEIYEMNDSGVRQALREAMASNNKIQVRIVIEPHPIGESCVLFEELETKRSKAKPKLDKAGRVKAPKAPTEACLEMRKFADEIRAQNFDGPKFVAFNKEELCGQERKRGACFQHGKLIVIDKKWALVSTGNFNSTNLCDLNETPRPKKCNRDYSYVTRDPEAVQAFSKIIEGDLLAKRYSNDLKELLNSGGLPDKITVSPYSLAPLSQFILSANKSLQIQNQYIHLDSGLVEPLIKTAKSGVTVEILLTDLCNFGSISVSQQERFQKMFTAMEAAGIQVKMFTNKKTINSLPGYLHAKVIVVDGDDPNLARAWVGSVNGSKGSLSQNREFGIFFSNRERVQGLSKFLFEDFGDKTNLTWQNSLACNKDQSDDEADPKEDSATEEE